MKWWHAIMILIGMVAILAVVWIAGGLVRANPSMTDGYQGKFKTTNQYMNLSLDDALNPEALASTTEAPIPVYHVKRATCFTCMVSTHKDITNLVTDAEWNEWLEAETNRLVSVWLNDEEVAWVTVDCELVVGDGFPKETVAKIVYACTSRGL